MSWETDIRRARGLPVKEYLGGHPVLVVDNKEPDLNQDNDIDDSSADINDRCANLAASLGIKKGMKEW